MQIVRTLGDHIPGKDYFLTYAVPEEVYTSARLKIPLDPPEDIMYGVKLEIMLGSIPYH